MNREKGRTLTEQRVVVLHRRIRLLVCRGVHHGAGVVRRAGLDAPRLRYVHGESVLRGADTTEPLRSLAG